MLKRVDIVGNPNIGVFILATDDIAIVPYNLIDEKAEIIKSDKLVSSKKEIVTIEGDMIVPDVKPDILNTIDTVGNVCIYKKEVLKNTPLKFYFPILNNFNTKVIYKTTYTIPNVKPANTSLA